MKLGICYGVMYMEHNGLTFVALSKISVTISMIQFLFTTTQYDDQLCTCMPKYVVSIGGRGKVDFH